MLVCVLDLSKREKNMSQNFVFTKNIIILKISQMVHEIVNIYQVYNFIILKDTLIKPWLISITFKLLFSLKIMPTVSPGSCLKPRHLNFLFFLAFIDKFISMLLSVYCMELTYHLNNGQSS